MKNNTKLIMETWRKFLNEGNPLDPASLDAPFKPCDDSVPSRYPESFYDEASQGIDDDSQGIDDDSQGIDDKTTLNLIRQGAPEYLIQAQAEIEELSPEEVEDLRTQFASENEDAFEERYGDDGAVVYDPNNPEVYVSDDSDDSEF